MLSGRVVGERRRPTAVPVGDVQPDAAAWITSKDATHLRTRDFFPPLPAALWHRDGPYFVELAICVSTTGEVQAAALRTSLAPPLDARVLAASRTWRYRPRLVGGVAQPFCHLVVVRYDRAL